MAREIAGIKKKSGREVAGVKVNTDYFKGVYDDTRTQMDTIQSFNQRANNREYLTSDDISAYRNAIQEYVKGVDVLRAYNGSKMDTIDPEWEQEVMDLEKQAKLLEEYYGKYANEDEYKAALAEIEKSIELQNRYEAYDREAGQAEIDEMKADLDSLPQYNSGDDINLYNAQMRDALLALSQKYEKKSASPTAGMEKEQNRFESAGNALGYLDTILSRNDLQKMLNEKTEFQAEYDNWVEDEKIYSNTLPDFEKYFSVGKNADVESVGKMNTEYMMGMNGQPIGYDAPDNTRVAALALAAHNGHDIGRWAEDKDVKNYLNEMTDDEFDRLSYYIGKDQVEGTNLTERYLFALERHIDQRKGKDIFSKIEGKHFLEKLYGGIVGLDGFVQGIKGLASDEKSNATAIQYAGQMIREDLKNDTLKYYNFATGKWNRVEIFGSSTGQVIYDNMVSTGNMLPSIAVSALVEAILPTVGEGGAVFAGLTASQIGAGTGALVLGASAAGNAKQEMINLGYDTDTANAYGTMVGLSEAGLSYLMSGIPGIKGSDGAFSALGKKVVTKVDHAIAKVAITLGADMLDEGVEEGLQTVLEAWFKGIATNTDWDAPGIDEVLYSSLLGMLTSAGFGGGRLVVSKTADTIGLAKTGASLKKSGTDSTLIEKGFGLENTKAGDIAASLRKKADAGKRVSNIKLGKLSRNLSESQISAAIQSELGEGSRDLADSVSAIIKGKAVSDKSIKAILQNEKALSILNDTIGTSIKAEDSVSAVRKATEGAIGATEAKQGREREFDRENVVKSLSANLDANNVEAYADTIVSLADGEIVSDREITAVLNNKYARNALNKYLGKSFKEGATANDVRAALVEGDFSRKGQAILYGTTLGIGGNGLKGLVSVVNNSRADASQIAQAYNAIYQAAKGGKGIHDVKNAYLDTLTPAQRNMAYEYGVMDSLVKTDKKEQTNESEKTEAAVEVDENVDNSVDKKVDEEVPEDTDEAPKRKEKITPAKNVTEEHKRLINVGKKIGIEVEIARIQKNGKDIDSMYVRSEEKIYINPKSANPAFELLKHELTHFTEKSDKYSNFLLETVDSKAFKEWLKGKGFKSTQEYIADKIATYKEVGKELSIPQAQQEMVANFVAETLFADDGSMERFVEALAPTQRNKFRQFIKDVIDWFKSVLGMTDEVERLEKRYAQIFADAKNITAQEFVDATKDTAYNYAFIEDHKLKLSEKYSNSAVSLETLQQRYDKIIEIWEILGGQLDSKFLNEWNSKKGKDRAFTIFKAQSGYKYNIELSSMCKKGVPLFEAIDTIVKSEAMKELKVDKLGKAEKEILYDLLKSDGFDIPCAICYVEQARQREGDIINAFLNGNEEGKVGWNQVLAECEEKMKAAGVDYKFPALDRSVATDKYVARKLTMTETEQNAFYEALKGIANREIKNYNDSHQSDKKFKPRKLVTSLTPTAINDVFKGNISADLKIYKVLFQNPDSRFTIDGDLLYASTTTHNLAYSHQALYSLFNQQGGVSGYKTKQGNVVYWGDILEKKWEASKLRKEGGIRYQSNSDSQMYTLLDQVQMFIDLTAKGYYLQSYSKVLSYLKLLGLSKGKINASLIPKVVVYRDANGDVDVAKTQENAGLDENGNPIYDDFEGINHAEAFMLIEDPDYSRSVGGVCIGYSDNHIRALLDDSRIQLIIGFHDKTNNPDKRYRGARYAKNYNGINEAVDSEGKTVHIGFNQFAQQAEKMFTKSGEDFTGTATYNGKEYKANDIPRLAADLYLEMCAKKGYKPAYNIEGIVDHPNYYKLLADFSLYDSKGNYAPHQKVAYNMPDQVPYLDENGHKHWMKSERYIKAELEKELKVRDDIAAKLADKSEAGLIPRFIKAVNGESSENTLDNQNDVEYNEDDSQYAYNPSEDELDSTQNKIKDIYTSKRQFVKEVAREDRSAFTKHLSSLTKDMNPGEVRLVEVNGASRIYLFIADGYMSGTMYRSISNKRLGLYRKFREDFYNGVEQNREGDALWAEFDTDKAGTDLDVFSGFGYAGKTVSDDLFFEETSGSNGERYKASGGTHNYSDSEIDDLIRKARETVESFGKDEQLATNDSDAEYSYSPPDENTSDRDSDGNVLSKGQQEFFKNSKVRDKDGNLLVAYHGTPNGGFYMFDYDKVGTVGGTQHGYGFYFTDSEREAKLYAQGTGTVMKVYINITNPIEANSNDLAVNVGTIFDRLPMYAKNNIIEKYGDLDTAKKHFAKYDNGTMLSILCKQTKMYPEVFNRILRNLGFDGIVYSEEGYATEYVAFESNQAKLTTNQTPTNNDDIRYSYTPPKSETFQELLKQYEDGAITREEYLELLRGKTPKNDPVSLANMTPNDFDMNTTPAVQRRTGNAKGDGQRRAYDTLQKSRIFDQRFKDEVKTDDFIKKYVTITNEDTLLKAAKELDDEGMEGVKKWFNIAPERASVIDVVKGFILMDRYQRVGDVEGQVAVAQKVGMMGTAAGQTVQAFSILRRLDPQAMMLYAQKSMQDAYETMVKGKTDEWIKKHKDRFKLTDEDIDYIYNRTVAASQLPHGRDKDVMIAQIAQRLQDKLPPEKGQTIKAVQRISMLLNPKTAIRNILGNASITYVHWVSDWIGTAVDSLLAKKTGVRTTSAISNVKEDIKAFKRGAYESYEDFVKKINTQLDLDRFDVRKASGKSFDENQKFKALQYAAKAANAMDRLTSFTLAVGDRPFYEYWFVHSLNAQKRANNVDVPTAAMIEIATQEALQRTWQDNNSFTELVTKFKSALNAFNIGGYGLGDVFIKFTKTPANLAKAIYDFSPAGFVSVAADAVKFKRAVDSGVGTAFAQKKFVKSLSNAIAGTLLYVGAVALFKSGRLTGENDDDKDVAAFEKWVQGIPAYSIKLGGRWFSYEWMQPVGSVAAIVSDYMDAVDDGTGAWDSVVAAIRSGGNVLFNQSFLQSLQRLFTADNIVDGFIDAVVADPSAFIPQISSQFANVFDKTRRVTYDNSSVTQTFLNSIKYKIPGLRNTLTEDVDVFGRDVPNSQSNVGNAFFNPANTYVDTSDEITNHVYDLFKTLGDKSMIPAKAPYSVKIGDNSKALSTEERAAYQRVMGTVAYNIISGLLQSEVYNSYSDTEKGLVISDVYKYANKVAMASIGAEATFEMAKDLNPTVRRDTFNAMTSDQKKELWVDYQLQSYSKIKDKDENGAIAYFENKAATSAVINSTMEYDSEKAKRIIDTAIENVKKYSDSEDAVKDMRANIKRVLTEYWKPFYQIAYYEGNDEEMKRIRETLEDTGLYTNLYKTLNQWVK